MAEINDAVFQQAVNMNGTIESGGDMNESKKAQMTERAEFIAELYGTMSLGK
ncbi:MAG: hypothetical protein V2A63_00295 [Patescibacteria group bacterium]